MTARDDPRSTSELVGIALTHEEDDVHWDAVHVLRMRGTKEVFDAMRGLCKSDRWLERELGADVLGQLGTPGRPFADETLPVLLDLLDNDENPDVLCSAAIAVQGLDDPRAVEALVQHKNHSDGDVRSGVVHGLGWRVDSRAVETLIEMTEDSDSEVRDWATFFLAQNDDLDTAEIRETLLSRTNDSDPETRGEALRGLAGRRDARVIEPLIRELRTIAAAEEYWDLAFEAAEAIADEQLYPELLALQEKCGDNKRFQEAIQVCRPASP